MNFDKRLSLSLFTLRLGVFIVMFMWTIDKFINPKHATLVFEKYYHISGGSTALAYGFGAAQLLLVIAFGLGMFKKWTYGVIFVMHTISTLSAWKMYIDPWGPKNLLFFAAWPMLAAIFSLYVLREKDTMFTISN